jgi:hypothetical protein
MTFPSIEDALDHIQGAIGFVRRELRDGGDHDALCDLETALTTMSDALHDALRAYSRLSPGRRWRRS